LSTLIIFVQLLIFSAVVNALDPDRTLSQYKYNKWGVDQKLPQITITALEQDKKGYIWVGTQNGVARFNGNEFVTFNQSNNKAFTSSIIVDLLIDSKNNLWILTDVGVITLKDKGFKSIKTEKTQLIKPSSLIEYRGDIFISSVSGVFTIDGQELVPFKTKIESYSLAVFNQKLFIGGRGQIQVLDSDNVSTLIFPPGYASAQINDIQVIGDEVWLASSKGILVYSEGKFRPVTLRDVTTNKPINAFYLDENQILWVATNTGLLRIKDSSLLYPEDYSDYSRVSTFMLGRDKTLWLGTSDRGLYQLRDSWSVRYGQDYGINESLVWSVTSFKGSELLVGTDKGVYRKADGYFVPFIEDSLLPDPSAYTLFIDLDNSVWVGTKGGIAHFDENANPIEDDFHKLLLGMQINGVYRDSKETLWFATSHGIFRLIDGNLKRLGEGTRYEQESFRTVIEHDRQIYFGSQVGLLKFDGQSSMNLIDVPGLQTFITSSINYKDTLIIGTYSNGLYTLSDSMWRNINKEKGLIFNDSFSLNILNDALWVSGFDGVYRINIEQLESFSQGVVEEVTSDPILNDRGYIAGSQKAYCCNGAGHAKSAILNGNIWLPTRDGVLKLEPSKVIKEQSLVKTVIETLTIGKVDFDMYFYDSQLEVHQLAEFDMRDIVFEYSGLSSTNNALVSYKYRMLGYSPDWIEHGVNRSATYTNLPPGDYTFEVMASNSNGLWPAAPTQFHFKIIPKFYETIYFKMALIIVLLLVFYGFYRLLIYRNKRKVYQLEQMVHEKTKELLISNNKLAEANTRLSIFSYTDPLTGVHNRRYFVKQIESDISHYVRRAAKEPTEQNIVLMLIDLDFFKDVNDKYGHNTGDEILKQVVDTLAKNVRDGDYLIRWGGEEFLIALRPNHVSAVEDMCSRLLKTISSQSFAGTNQETINLTISIGYCYYPMLKNVVDVWSWEDALEITDRALYQSKSNGRNQWVGFQLLPSVIDNFKAGSKFELDDDSFQRFSGVG